MSDPLAAVLAHGLLNSLAVVDGTAISLRRSWARFSDEQRDDFCRLLVRHSELVADQAGDLPGLAAHKLANHIFVVRGVAETIERERRFLSDEDREHLFDVLLRQSAHAATVLANLVRGLPIGAGAMLDELDGSTQDREATA
ncbi:MAG TPA: hypothetical protein VFA94_07180 [Acidimicrobiales bacterium]|nr:hypothetical protein [Acidimicrobiales bacterium]